ncbi:PDDEXK-like uncharacterized protein DUF3799 [Pantoea sp. PNA 14-12]|nr:PDDEXK-like uncharacterized protein DUF3799 [Pantoea sp. PNA 14-12]
MTTSTVTEKTASGATAGGGIKTDRNPDYEHTLQTLGIEIACALFPSDFDIYEIPTPIFRRAKEMVAERNDPCAAWNRALSNTPGILDNSRAAIFALIRSAPEDIHLTPGQLQYYINSTLAETDHANPSQETLAAAHSTNNAITPEPEPAPATTAVPVADEPIKNMGNGIFDVTALLGETAAPQVETHAPVAEPVTAEPAETTSNESEKTEVVPEIADIAETFPAVFEPGLYENIPNEAYHAASGISSSMVKDARISLMYFHGRHVTGVIQREVTDVLTFGTLVHTLALEPEKLEQEFAIFPGIPAGAFTNTDSLKAFIREFNADKPKAEQLKLTGKKEELQEAIRAVKPDAIFADEFEQKWLNDNCHKTILTSSQMSLATDIRTALLRHPSVANLLNHPSRVNEVSYFGMDDETGLEVRVRPDIELEIDGIRIAADLKTTSMGRIKQGYLRPACTAKSQSAITTSARRCIPRLLASISSFGSSSTKTLATTG